MADAFTSMNSALAAAKAAGIGAQSIAMTPASKGNDATDNLNELSLAHAKGQERPHGVPTQVTLPLAKAEDNGRTAELNDLSAAQGAGQPRPKNVPTNINLPVTAEQLKINEPSDSDIQKALESQAITLPTGSPHQRAAQEQFNQIAAQMGFKTPPALLVDNGYIAGFQGQDMDVPLAISVPTKDDHYIIAVTPAFFEKYTPREQRAVLEHELRQIHDGNGTADKMAQQLNDPQEAIRLKYRTDAESTDPEALKSALLKSYKLDAELIRKQNLSWSVEQLEGLIDSAQGTYTGNLMPQHPRAADRVKRLDERIAQTHDHPDIPTAPLPTPARPPALKGQNLGGPQ
jgi:hypothetical protein